MEKFTNIFKALSDKTRLRIIWLLSKASSPLCVCEIMDSLAESQYNVSRHLKVLKGAGLVKESKDGRWVYYSLQGLEDPFRELILKAISGLSEESLSPCYERLKMRLSLRKNGRCVVGMNSEKWQKQLKQLKLRRNENV